MMAAIIASCPHYEYDLPRPTFPSIGWGGSLDSQAAGLQYTSDVEVGAIGEPLLHGVLVVVVVVVVAAAAAAVMAVGCREW